MEETAKFMVAILKSSMVGFWHRFTPSLALNVSRNSTSDFVLHIQTPSMRRLEANLHEMIAVYMLHYIDREISNVNFLRPISNEIANKLTNMLEISTGFRLCLRQSDIAGAGKGVFVEKGSISMGSIAALYPGTIYHVGDPILLQSINNHYLLKCKDGLLVDGKPYGLSAKIYKSCVYQDLSPNVCDMSWLNPETSFNYINLGHYVNNGGTSHHNVQYVDIDISNWPFAYRKYLPYANYRPPRTAAFRIVALVACRQIEEGEELLSPYISVDRKD